MRSIHLPLIAAFSGTVYSQYFPPTPEGITTLKSKYHEGVTVSYKEPGICETTPGVKSYSGYVHLPPGLLSDINGEDQDYPINTFFWFFEARKDPTNAPLSIWLNGGPGGSSMMGLLQENGPCFVGADSNSTYLNPFSWNNEVNMIYLDQPSQVGFSYDVATNGTFNLEEFLIYPIKSTESIPEQNNTVRVGTFASQALNTTANSTVHAAHAIWHFAQTWFFEFPNYKPHNDRISLWTESYGGRYGPMFVRFFQEQNEKILNGTIKEKGTKFIHLDTLGIVNGYIDALSQELAYAEMAYNNTYGIKAVNETVYEGMVKSYSKQGGCKDQTVNCQNLMAELDPNATGSNYEVNSYCSKAMNYCESNMQDPYIDFSNHGTYDIAHPAADPFPEPYLHGYLQQHWVQKALGVPVNYTAINMRVNEAFASTGDILRADGLESIAYLLDSGVKVVLVYGDRDYACNWIGGEKASTAVSYSRAKDFSAAGYQPIMSTVGIGGRVRQFGNYSFSRVYQAGHEVPSYQPEVAYEIFMRSLLNRDIATGFIAVTENYTTAGPSSTWHIKNTIPMVPQPTCYILYPGSCTAEQYAAVKNGTALIKDYIVVEDKTEQRVEIISLGHGIKEEQYSLIEEL